LAIAETKNSTRDPWPREDSIEAALAAALA